MIHAYGIITFQTIPEQKPEYEYLRRYRDSSMGDFVTSAKQIRRLRIIQSARAQTVLNSRFPCLPNIAGPRHGW
jgi:hypothetical protein